MKIIEPSVSLLWITQRPLKAIELAGRTAYKSEDKITDESEVKFLKMIMSKGHDSVIEHASASMRFICDRGVTHEIVRHRLFSFTQESTRYCNYGSGKFGNEITVIKPLMDERSEYYWRDAMVRAEMDYLQMLALGSSPQIARSVLPNSLKTEIVITGNFLEWRHFLRLRTGHAAHPQMRQVAQMALSLLREAVPIVFDDL